MIDFICFKDNVFDLGYSDIKIVDVIKINSFKELRKMVSGNKGLVIVEGGNLNRTILENKKADILLSPEKGRKKDFIHNRNSGLNQVLCKIAKKNDIAVGFSFSEILNSNDRCNLLGRMMQNIRLCRKYKVKMVFGSFANNKYEMRNAKDLFSFCRVLGMTGSEAKEALNYKKEVKGIRVIKNEV